MALRIIEWREPGMHNLHEGLLIDSSTETIYCRSVRPLAHMQEGRTPLHHASQAGKEAAVAALLEAKADVNLTDKVRRLAIGEYGCGCIAINDREHADFCMLGKGVFIMALRLMEWREPGMHILHDGLLIDS